MAKLLAIEWDDREARVAVASTRGSDLVVDEAFAVDIATATASESADDVQAVAQRIAEAVAQRGLKGSDVLVGLGRTSIELRSLSLPPAPSEELPDMVRFQAMQAFTSIGEDWPLDFVELSSHDDSVNVLAAVVSPKQVDQILQVCAASDLKPRCLVLRPFAAASLLNRSGVLAAGRNALVVDLLADGADLTAVSQGQVVFMRTVRTPATTDQGTLARTLLGEVRRTIAAAQSQMSGQRIEQIVICGGPTEHPLLAQSLTEALSLEVVTFDPFQAVRLGHSLERQLPADAGRYAPLLGMLADEVAGVRHAIDFLNPRKRPVARSNRRRNILIAASSVSVAALILLSVWGGLRRLDGQIRGLQEESNELNVEVDRANKLVARADSIKEFTNRDVTWLDELHELAVRIPDADRVLLKEVQYMTELNRGAIMSVRGNVTSPDVIEKFELSLRYGDNEVAGRQGIIDKKQTEYRYVLDTSIALSPDKYDGGRPVGRPIRDEIRQAAAQAKQSSPTQKVDTPAQKPEAKSAEPPAGPPAGPPAERSELSNAGTSGAKPVEQPEPAPGNDQDAKPKPAPDSATPAAAQPPTEVNPAPKEAADDAKTTDTTGENRS